MNGQRGGARLRRCRSGVLVLTGAFFVTSLPAPARADSLPGDREPEKEKTEKTAAPPASPADAADLPKIQCFTRHEDAQVSRRRGRLLEAREALRTCSRAACPSAIRADCVEWLDQIERSIPSVVVTASDSGVDLTDVRVLINGEPAAERLTGAAIEVDPGEHQFRFEAPGRSPIERKILLGEGTKRRPIDIDFSPPPPPAARGAGSAVGQPPAVVARKLGAFDYVAGGLALTALGTSAYFGAWALVARNDLQGDCAPLCSDVQRESVETKLLVADLALGVAAFSLVLLYLHRFSVTPTVSAARRSSLSLDFGTHQRGGGLGLRGRF